VGVLKTIRKTLDHFGNIPLQDIVLKNILRSGKVRLVGTEFLFCYSDKLGIDFVADRVPVEVFCRKTGSPAAHERIEHRFSAECEHPDQAMRKLFRKHGDVAILLCSGKVPVSGETGVPLFGAHGGALFLLFCRLGRISRLFEQENELIIELENAVARIREASHNGCPASGVGCGHLLPDHRAHVVETDSLAEPDDLRPDRDNLVPAVIHRTGELVADVDAEPAAGMQHPFALAPDKIQIVDVALIAVVKSDLVLRPVVLELPVGRRGNDKVNRTVRQQIHLPAVAFYYGVTSFQRLGFCL